MKIVTFHLSKSQLRVFATVPPSSELPWQHMWKSAAWLAYCLRQLAATVIKPQLFVKDEEGNG